MASERLAKSDIAQKVAERTNLPKAQATRVVDAMLDVLQEELARGAEIRITGFGSWRVVETKARTGRNPRTGQPLKIPASKRVSFSPGARLTEVVRTGRVNGRATSRADSASATKRGSRARK
jgi:DNA-binding protein HU-beta